ncbi:unnamed protein product [Clavelina lepadiformis]|uniref:P-type domain-containing protein n=1 Tax=Clavelina lepadiformis TaxID=159417 RepID=A0ABP0F5V2_CLALP
MVKIAAFIGLIAAFFTVADAQRPTCNSRAQRTPCGTSDREDECSTACCFDATLKRPYCFLTEEAARGRSRALNRMKEQAEGRLREVEKPDNFNSVTEQARALTGAEPEITGRVQARGLNFGGGNSLLGFALDFPACAVPTPFCHRTRCNVQNPAAEFDPIECYKDPSCCFDKDLFLYKAVFGPGYMGGAPVCYNGPTASRYRQIAASIQPWNPFFQEAVVNIFEDIFDTALNFQQQIICRVTSLLPQGFGVVKCGWEGITKLQCNLKGCCYNDDDDRCNYPTTLGGQLVNQPYNPIGNFGFGNLPSQEYYPELIAQTPDEAVCQPPFSPTFNPNIFRRLPCQCNSDISGYTSLLFRCQTSNCCQNILGLLPELSGFAALSGGVPPNLLTSNPLLTPVLFSQGFSNVDFTDFFCPYFYFPIPGFPDLDDFTDNCCTIHSCYHKKISVFQPPPVVPQARWGSYGPFGPCQGCGSSATQTRSRQCLHSDGRQSDTCQGSAVETQSCVGPPCAAWGGWRPYGSCSVACGSGGTQTRSRTCLSNGRPSGGCPGSSTSTRPCTGSSCSRWGPYGPWGNCNAQCGGAGTEIRSRSCIGGSGCQGPRQESRQCNGPPCYRVGAWRPWSPCTSECVRYRSRDCLDRNNQPTNPSNCLPNQLSQEGRCTGGTCLPTPSTPWVVWGDYTQYTPCTRTCGQGTRTRERPCYYRGRSNSPIHPQFCICAYGGELQESQTCNLGPCFATQPTQYFWGDFSAWTVCSQPCSPGQNQQRSRRCFRRNNAGQLIQVNSNLCPGSDVETRPCPACGLPSCPPNYYCCEWSACPDTCGGTRVRCRCLNPTCRNEQPNFDRYNCPAC